MFYLLEIKIKFLVTTFLRISKCYTVKESKILHVLRKPLTRLTDLSFLKAPRKKYIYQFSNLIIFAVKFSIKTKFSLAEKIHNQCLCKTQVLE